MNEKKYFVSELIFNYLDYLENIKGLSSNTAVSYKRDLVKLSKFLNASGVNDFESLTEEICSAWIADLFQKNISDSLRWITKTNYFSTYVHIKY